ncbi:MAG TPA: SAM-dependent methyltransferase [Bacteriovoracaceae bacterium]|nr:SAM-dependent methyltransferase [Bacteriovoracaceae bacterium]
MTLYTGYLAIHKFEAELEKELELKGVTVALKKDRLYLVEGQRPAMIWAQMTAYKLKQLPITSIKDGAKKLRKEGRNWSVFTVGNHRRAQLIQEELPDYNQKPIAFRAPVPTLPMGFWTLLEPDMILATTETSSPYALGEMTFTEDRTTPPSRAYLKLWEFFTVYAPEAITGGTSLDVGSCPGGWTWVLRTLEFEKIISVDKAPIEQKIMDLGKIDFRQESAFGLDPKDFGEIDWFCSDIICYPDRLLTLVKKFLASGKVKNFVCTIKYQAETDWVETLKFLEIPGSQIVHLHHNKHEVTWFLKGASA